MFRSATDGPVNGHSSLSTFLHLCTFSYTLLLPPKIDVEAFWNCHITLLPGIELEKQSFVVLGSTGI